ncbi:MAG: transposase, partial [Spirochaetota bacterium]
IHTKVRDPYRLWAKENYERRRKVYRKRYMVEQMIAKAKNIMGDRDRVRDFHMASLYVLARFVILNLALLVKLFILWLKL